jgi:hypothetical protein
MKFFSICLAAIALASSVVTASAAFTFKGTYKDKLITDPDTGDYWVFPTGSTSVSGTIAVSHINTSAIATAPDVMILLDNGSSGILYFSMADAVISGTASKPVITYTDSVDSVLSTETTKVVLSFTTNSMTATITANHDAFSLGSTPNGTLSKSPTLFSIAVGDITIDTTLYLSGTSTTLTKTVTEYGSYDLTSVTLSGQADTTAPTVAFTAPANKSKTSNDTPLSVTGSVKDTYSISQVVYFCTNTAKLAGDETFTTAELTRSNAWQASVTLTPGTNYVFVKAVDGAYNWSKPVSRMFYYAKMASLNLAINGNGTVTGVSNGQALELGHGYTATAKPLPGNIFRGWKDADGNVLSTNLSTTFLMSEGLTLRAAFIPNPFTRAKGTYNGLFYGYDTNGTTLIPTNSGLITLTLTSNGTYSAKATQVSGSYSFTGALALSGDDTNSATAAFSIKRSKLPNLEGSITIDLTGSGLILGDLWQTITSGGQTNRLTASFDGLLASTAKPGVSTLYNLAVTGLTNLATGEPGPSMGAGYGRITIDKNNRAKLSLTLADGTPAFTAASSLSISNSFPVFSSLYSKTGVFMGWVTSVTNETSDFETTDTLWIRPPTRTPKYYTNGFSLQVSSMAALYTAPKTGTNILGWTNGIFQWGGSLNEIGVTKTINFIKNKFTFPDNATAPAKFTLAPATGILTGTFGSGKTAIPFKAVILPKIQSALGFSTGTTNTGWILLYPKP